MKKNEKPPYNQDYGNNYKHPDEGRDSPRMVTVKVMCAETGMTGKANTSGPPMQIPVFLPGL